MAGLTLKPYQNDIVRWALEHPRCGIWARMGAGKTAAMLGYVAARRALGDERPVLVLAPKHVAAHTWPDEARKWAHLGVTVSPVIGTPEQRIAALREPADVYTINYENVEWLAHHADPWPFETVIADESTRLKSFRLSGGGRRARALGRLAHRKIAQFVELTGTPTGNGLLDLWGQAWFLDEGQRLGRTFTTFTMAWFRPHPSGFGFVPLRHAAQEIIARLSDICITIQPPVDPGKLVVTDLPVYLPAGAMETYREMERRLYAAVMQDSITAPSVAAASTKCRQIASGAVYVDGEDPEQAKRWTRVHTAKLEVLRTVIEEAAGAPVLVAVNFRHEVAEIQGAFPQAVEFNGADAMRAWNEGQIPILLLHPASAGHGLNLQYGGNILVWYSLPWSLELYEQTVERIGPMRQQQAGFDRPTLVYRLLAKGTIDERIAVALSEKRTVQEYVLTSLVRPLQGVE